jgi:hypothetical protein
VRCCRPRTAAAGGRPQGHRETFTVDVSKEAGNHLATMSCSFSITTTDPETGDLVSIVGTVEVVLTPRAG